LFCGWLVDGADERAVGADPLADLAARDYAASDFKRFLRSERALGPASVNLGLASVDHLYRQLGLGRANVRRESLPASAGRCSSCSSVSGAASAMLPVSTLIARPTCREPPAQAVRKEQPIPCGLRMQAANRARPRG
jgi:hypothetical protein